jgi:hypothetical protein
LTAIYQDFLAWGASLIKENRLNNNPLSNLQATNAVLNLANSSAAFVANNNGCLLASERVRSGRNKLRAFKILVETCGFPSVF